MFTEPELCQITTQHARMDIQSVPVMILNHYTKNEVKQSRCSEDILC